MSNTSIVTAEQLRKRKYQLDLKRSYADLLKEAEAKSDEAVIKAKHITLEHYIPLLCERLRVEKFKNVDMETSKIEDIKKMRDDVKQRIFNDCYWWEPESIRHYWPEWVKDEFLVDLRKAEAKGRRDEFTEKTSVKEAESNELAAKEFNMLSSVMQQVKTPAKEKERKSEGLGVASLQDLQPRTPDPLELYEDTVRGIAEIWKNLANKDILPTKMDDVFGDCIKPSRKFRQRLIKGLDDARAAHLHNSLVWLNQLINDTLEMMDEIEKESINKPGK